MIENRNQQEEALKHVIQQLHEGKTVEEVQEEFATLIEDVGAMDIAELEQALIEEGMPESEIQRLCDIHVAVFRESLEREVRPDTTPGHPINTFLAENAAAGRVLNLLEEALNVVKDEPTAEQLAQARERLEELLQYEKHYLRKENVLFPYLEKHGLSGPTTVMWEVAALGVALLIKLAGRTRPQDVLELSCLLDQLLTVRGQLLTLAQADASAITAWISTRHLDESDPKRQAALRTMVEVPLEAGELCRTARREAQPLLECGHPPARPDGEVGVQLLEVSQHSLRYLAQANIRMLRDPSLIETMRSRLEDL